MGLAFTQNGLSQLVDVHPDAGLAPAAQVGAQFSILRRKNHVGALLPQLAGNHGHHYAGKLYGEFVPQLHGEPVRGGQITGNTVAVQQVAEQLRAPRRRGRAEHAVRQRQRKGLARRVVHHALHLLRLLFLLPAHPGIRLFQNGFRQFHSLGGQLLVSPFVTARRRHHVRDG